ncbi:transposase family protein [Micromonospora sp. NPDC050417]|uniref:transposase family protein n=1 Tax=Micromonospora sp. NPDC050417 TaxID=3364280 RepID=UPI003799730F
MEASSLIGGLSARLGGVSPLSERGPPGLLQALAEVPDPRDARSRIHPLPGLLAMAIAAVLSGSSRVEIVEWAADLPDVVWERLGAARDASTGARRVTDDGTLGRVLVPASTPTRWIPRCVAGCSAGLVWPGGAGG